MLIVYASSNIPVTYSAMKKAFAWRDIMIVALFAATTGFSSILPPPRLEVIDTSYGPVTGFAGTTASCTAFYGIPYAAPPTGEYRFKPPQPMAPWKKPRPAIEKTKTTICPQTQRYSSAPPDLLIKPMPMSEDCLFLNVWTPHYAPSSGSSLPVLVFIHGGIYKYGSGVLTGGWPGNDLSDLCANHGADGDVVMVTLNYRLGVFGFFASDELLAEPQGTAGNMGLQDQREALKWVHANIAAFGGNPSRVTLWGQSAGGSSVTTHLTTAQSSPFFSAAIVMSPGLVAFRSFESASNYCDALAGAAGCNKTSDLTNSTLACMRRLDWLELLGVQDGIGLSLDGFHPDQAVKTGYKAGDAVWGPTSDGFEYPRSSTQYSVLQSGSFSPKPILVGGNTNEKANLACHTEVPFEQDSFRRHIKEDYGIASDREVMDNLTALYDSSRHSGNWRQSYIAASSDAGFSCVSRVLLDAFFKAGAPTFQYLLTSPLNGTNPYQGVCMGPGHGEDLDLAFFSPFAREILHETPAEENLSKRMKRYLVTFVALHTPPTEWPRYGANRAHLAFSATVNDSVGMQYRQEQCNFLDTSRMTEWKVMPCADLAIDVPLWSHC